MESVEELLGPFSADAHRHEGPPPFAPLSTFLTRLLTRGVLTPDQADRVYLRLRLGWGVYRGGHFWTVEFGDLEKVRRAASRAKDAPWESRRDRFEAPLVAPVHFSMRYGLAAAARYYELALYLPSVRAIMGETHPARDCNFSAPVDESDIARHRPR